MFKSLILGFPRRRWGPLENRCVVHKLLQGCFSRTLGHEPQSSDTLATEHKTKGEGPLCTGDISGVQEFSCSGRGDIWQATEGQQ